VSEVRRTF
jgi:hypothetical protein